MLEISSSFKNLADGIGKITVKWPDTLFFKIPDLKVLSTKVFQRMWSNVVAVFLITLVGLFKVGIIHFDILDLKNLALFKSFHNLKY